MSTHNTDTSETIAVWDRLSHHFQEQFRHQESSPHLADMLTAQRVEKYTLTAPHMVLDLSKNLLDDTARSLLNQLAVSRDVELQRARMFAGEAINRTEGRSVLHTLLRRFDSGNQETQPHAIPLPETLQHTYAKVKDTRDAMLHYAERVRKDTRFTDVVLLGVGGSYLGPKMVCRALQHLHSTHLRIHFVSNVDAHAMHDTMQQLPAKSTLFIVASKSFGTLETLTNARLAKSWLEQHQCAIAQHMVALTANAEAATEFGITTTLPFWDWVGGRFSIWSAIGLPVAISIGADAFTEFLHGAQDMDIHFYRTPLECNVPIQLALLDVWYRSIMGLSSRCTVPYMYQLDYFVPYLQQLEMESNGKTVTQNGVPTVQATQGIVFGEVGSDSQHAFFQLLHQGSKPVPLEIIAAARAHHPHAAQHRLLLANALAQARSLAIGEANDEEPHKHFSGNKPSTFMLLDTLSPESLGALIALYEHRTFVSGVLWDINSFDQYGVELGKTLAKDITPRLESGETDGLDASTAQLIDRIRQTEDCD